MVLARVPISSPRCMRRRPCRWPRAMSRKRSTIAFSGVVTCRESSTPNTMAITKARPTATRSVLRAPAKVAEACRPSSAPSDSCKVTARSSSSADCAYSCAAAPNDWASAPRASPRATRSHATWFEASQASMWGLNWFRFFWAASLRGIRAKASRLAVTSLRACSARTRALRASSTLLSLRARMASRPARRAAIWAVDAFPRARGCWEQSLGGMPGNIVDAIEAGHPHHSDCGAQECHNQEGTDHLGPQLHLVHRPSPSSIGFRRVGHPPPGLAALIQFARPLSIPPPCHIRAFCGKRVHLRRPVHSSLPHQATTPLNHPPSPP